MSVAIAIIAFIAGGSAGALVMGLFQARKHDDLTATVQLQESIIFDLSAEVMARA